MQILILIGKLLLYYILSTGVTVLFVVILVDVFFDKIYKALNIETAKDREKDKITRLADKKRFRLLTKRELTDVFVRQMVVPVKRIKAIGVLITLVLIPNNIFENK